MDITHIMLTPFNFFEWKAKMVIQLRSKGLFRVTMGTEVEPNSIVQKAKYFNKLDEAYGFLCLRISIYFFVPPFVIPKSYHHHVIRPLTYIFSLNPSTWSGNPYLFVNSTWKYLAPRFPYEPWVVPCSHCLHPIFHKRCHHLWPLVHKRFLSKLLCHNRRKAVPWIKWEK